MAPLWARRKQSALCRVDRTTPAWVPDPDAPTDPAACFHLSSRDRSDAATSTQEVHLAAGPGATGPTGHFACVANDPGPRFLISTLRPLVTPAHPPSCGSTGPAAFGQAVHLAAAPGTAGTSGFLACLPNGPGTRPPAPTPTDPAALAHPSPCGRLAPQPSPKPRCPAPTPGTTRTAGPMACDPHVARHGPAEPPPRPAPPPPITPRLAPARDRPACEPFAGGSPPSRRRAPASPIPADPDPTRHSPSPSPQKDSRPARRQGYDPAQVQPALPSPEPP